jgi:DNA-binding transcriptional ArsR family regulator
MPDTMRQFKATMFQALAHPTRIAILEQLRDGELTVGVILARLGLEPANASQHLAILRARHIVSKRKDGSQVFYSIRDPLITDILALMRRYFEVHVEESMSLLQDAVIKPDHNATQTPAKVALK